MPLLKNIQTNSNVTLLIIVVPNLLEQFTTWKARFSQIQYRHTCYNNQWGLFTEDWKLNFYTFNYQ